MTDKHGRVIDYLRISITDRCNLRCIYCMPEEGIKSISHNDILSFDQIVRICKVLAQEGLKKVKITGGEPLVRKGAVDLIRQIKAIEGIESVTITTNGVLLNQYYQALEDAGIDAITVSLDTINRETYNSITRRDELNNVLQGLKTAIEKSKVHIKINCVPFLGIDKQEILSLPEFAKNYDVDVRFIEVMPIGFGTDYNFVSEDSLKAVIEEKYGKLTPFNGKRGNGPGRYYSADGLKGKIGFISAVSHQFCDSCNRVRLTANGFLKTCLQYDFGIALKPLMDSGCTDTQLLECIKKAIEQKPKGHNFNIKTEFAGKEKHGMSQIGG